MKCDLAIQGDVVLPKEIIRNGILAISGAKVVGTIAPHELESCGQFLDYSGCLILPGAVDAHVHSSSTSEGTHFDELTIDAAKGGVTTVIDMPYDVPAPITSASQVEAKIRTINHTSRVDVALFGTVSKHRGWPGIASLVDAGICGLKVSTYETDPIRFPAIPDLDLFRIFCEAAQFDLTVAVHAENGEIIDPLVVELGALGNDASCHAKSRPPLSETTAVAKVLEVARVSGAKLHLVHLTVPFGIEMANWYRHRGVDVSVETCVHYLTLNEEHLHALGGVAKCNPPLRPLQMQSELWIQLMDDKIDFLTTDHVRWPYAQKAHSNIFQNKSGLAGLGLLIPATFNGAVVNRGWSPLRFARAISTAPARRYGLYPRKGTLETGADADIAVIDPRREWVVTADGADNSPYQGLSGLGQVVLTVLRGQVAFDGEEVVSPPGAGQFVRPVKQAHQTARIR